MSTRGGPAHVEACGQREGGQKRDFFVDVINGWPLKQRRQRPGQNTTATGRRRILGNLFTNEKQMCILSSHVRCVDRPLEIIYVQNSRSGRGYVLIFHSNGNAGCRPIHQAAVYFMLMLSRSQNAYVIP